MDLLFHFLPFLPSLPIISSGVNHWRGDMANGRETNFLVSFLLSIWMSHQHPFRPEKEWVSVLSKSLQSRIRPPERQSPRHWKSPLRWRLNSCGSAWVAFWHETSFALFWAFWAFASDCWTFAFFCWLVRLLPDYKMTSSWESHWKFQSRTQNLLFVPLSARIVDCAFHLWKA